MCVWQGRVPCATNPAMVRLTGAPVHLPPQLAGMPQTLAAAAAGQFNKGVAGRLIFVAATYSDWSWLTFYSC